MTTQKYTMGGRGIILLLVFILTLSVVYANESVICQASSSIDPDGNFDTYEFNWYRVESDGSLTPLQTETDLAESELEVSRFELQNNLYLCEVFALDSNGQKSNPERKIATLQDDYIYIPFGVIETNTQQIGDYVGENTIPSIVSISSVFDYKTNATCLYGECPNLQTTFLYSSQYLESLQGLNSIFPYFSNNYFISNATLLPNILSPFTTSLSSSTVGSNVAPSITPSYDISFDEEQQQIQDYARHDIHTIIFLEDNSNVTTTNTSIQLPDNTLYVDQVSVLSVQDRFFMLDPISVPIQSYTQYAIQSGEMSVAGNRFTPTGNGQSIVSATIDETTMTPYLSSLTSSLPVKTTTFYYDGFCDAYTIQGIDQPERYLPHFTNQSRIPIQAIKNYGDGVTETLLASSNVSLSFNDTALANYGLSAQNITTLKQQVEIQSNTNGQTILGYIVPRPNFNKTIFDSLFTTLPFTEDIISIEYTDSECGLTLETTASITFSNNTALCSYSTDVPDINHFTKYDGGNFGDVSLEADCGEGYFTVPESRISYDPADSSVVRNSNTQGIYQVLKEGTTVVEILHNGNPTGVNFTVSGVCGIQGIDSSSAIFSGMYSKGDEIQLDSLSTIPNSYCGNECLRDISKNVSSLSLTQSPAIPDYLDFSESTYETVTITSCGLAASTKTIDVTYNPNSHFFCSNTYEYTESLQLVPPNTRDVICDAATATSDLKNHVFTFIKESPEYEQLVVDTTRSNFNLVVRSVAEVVNNQEIMSQSLRLARQLSDDEQREEYDLNRLLQLQIDGTSTSNLLGDYVTQSQIQSICYENILELGDFLINGQIGNLVELNYLTSACVDASKYVLTAPGMLLSDSGYEACAVPKDTTDIVCCASEDYCVYEGVCYAPRETLDIDGDGLSEVCIA